MRTSRPFALLALVATILWSGCAVTTTVHFNKDYSGTYATELDMSEVIGMAAMFDTTGTMDQNQMIDEMRHSFDSMDLVGMYNSVSGIRDAKIEVTDEGLISIVFGFDNLSSLEASFMAMKDRASESAEGFDAGGMDMLPTDLFSGGVQTFSRSGKTLTHTYKSSEDAEGLLGEEGAGELDMISSMVDYTMIFSFDRKVKSSEADGMSILEQGPKMIKARLDIDRLIGGQYSISIKTK